MVVSKLMEIRPNRKLNVELFDLNSDSAVFFVHGLGGRAEQFEGLIKGIEETNKYNVIAYDMLGTKAFTLKV